MPVGARATHQESGNIFTIGYDGQTFMPEISETNTLIIRNDLFECRAHFTRADRDPQTGAVGPLPCR